MKERFPKWFFYAAILFAGLILTTALVFVAWNTLLQERRHAFDFEFSIIKEDLDRNIQIISDSGNDLATVLTADGAFDHGIFETFTTSVLAKQPFMDGIIYFKLSGSNDESRAAVDAEVFASRFRSPEIAANLDDIRQSKDFHNIMRSLSYNDWPAHIGSTIALQSRKYYIQLKPIRAAETGSAISGLLLLLADPQRLVNVIPDTLAVALYIISLDLNGRELVFSSPAAAVDKGPLIASFNRHRLANLPFHSVKLSVSKDIFWRDIDHRLLYVVLFIGSGITFLLFSLVRAREQHERDLYQRHAFIEAKVEEQTKKLAEARDQARESAHIKSEFLASMSHEIRTPLTAIIGMAESLAETRLDSDQERYVQVFKRAGDTLLTLVNDILDFSKIEAGQLILENAPFNLLDVVEESVAICALKASERNVELTSIIAPELPIKRIGDAARLEQIIINLVSNAVKFTEDGHVVIRVAGVADNKLEISITDTGIGISREAQKKIFSSFMQADSSTSRQYGGTGLGLTISKQLVEMMGGHIWVESEKGKGSKFSFNIDLPVNHSISTLGYRKKTFLQRKKILILDANQYNRDKLCSILQLFGADCAATGQCPPADELAGKEQYHYIFVDHKILFATGNGAQFGQVPKRFGAALVVAMLEPESYLQQRRCLEALGIVRYLVKPVRQFELLNIFSGFDAGERKVAPEAVAGGMDKTTATADDKRILLVEDNEDNRLLINTYLKGAPYIIDEAENGHSALALYKKNTYHLILMDIRMPMMDGHEAARAIRGLERRHSMPETPIIALTAHAVKEEIDKCMEAGCNTHVGKPIKKSALLDVVDEFIGC